MWSTYNESGLCARKKSDRASVHEQVRPDRAVHQLAATGSRLLSVKCFYKITITSQFSMGYLLATAFISVNAYFAQPISLEIRFASFSLCGAFHRVVQRRSEADSGAGSRKVVHRCRELEKCLLLRLPLPAPWALLLVDVLENMFCPLFDLVAALPLLSPRSHTRLLKARGCKRAK